MYARLLLLSINCIVLYCIFTLPFSFTTPTTFLELTNVYLTCIIILGLIIIPIAFVIYMVWYILFIYSVFIDARSE